MGACISCFAGLGTSKTSRPTPPSAAAGEALLEAPADEGVLPTRAAPVAFVPRERVQDGEKPMSIEEKISARKGDPETIDIMVSALGKTLRGLDDQGRTLLFYAVRGTRGDEGKLDDPGGSMEGPQQGNSINPGNVLPGSVVFHLVQKHGFDINFQVHDSGMTPLMEAVRYGNWQNAMALIQLGARWDFTNARGHTALDIARTECPEYLTLQECCCSHGKWEFLKTIIEKDRHSCGLLLEKMEEHGSLEKFLGSKSLQNAAESARQQAEATRAATAENVTVSKPR